MAVNESNWNFTLIVLYVIVWLNLHNSGGSLSCIQKVFRDYDSACQRILKSSYLFIPVKWRNPEKEIYNWHNKNNKINDPYNQPCCYISLFYITVQFFYKFRVRKYITQEKRENKQFIKKSPGKIKSKIKDKAITIIDITASSVVIEYDFFFFINPDSFSVPL